MFYLYILKSQNFGTYYIGSTSNIDERLKMHNNGFVKSTKGRKPWLLIYKEEFETLSEARKRELQLKSWKKRRAIESLINRGL